MRSLQRTADGTFLLHWRLIGPPPIFFVMPYAAFLEMNHTILGDIKRREGESGDGVATVRYDSREIKIQIIPDDQAFETALKIAGEVVARLDELDEAAKGIIVAHLRETYNNGWNEYDEVQQDGSLKSVSNPRLSEAEFKQKFSLHAVNVTGKRMVDFFYEDSGLFWGHSVVVNSLAGADFTNARAELFG